MGMQFTPGARVPIMRTQGGSVGSPATVDHWTVQPANTTNPLGAFKSQFAGATFGGVVETTWSVGYNVDRAVAKRSAYMVMHSDAGDVPATEIQWSLYTADGLKTFIPFQAYIRSDNNLGQGAVVFRHGFVSTDGLSFQNADGSVTYAIMSNAVGGINVYSALKVLPNSGTGALTVGSASGAADISIFPSGTNQGTITLYRSGAAAWQINQINGEFRINDSVNNQVAVVLRAGVAASNQVVFNGRVGLGTSSWGSGTGAVLGIANATVVPSTSPSAGGVLYAEAGAGKWRGSSGTVTTFGPAEPHCPTCGRDFVLEWQNDQYGHLAVCMWCVTEGTTKGVFQRVEAT